MSRRSGTRTTAAPPSDGHPDTGGETEGPAPDGPAAGAPAAKSREVAPGVFELFLPLPSRPTIVNVYLLDCGGEWALLDTGVALAASREAFGAALGDLGVDPRSIRHLVGTHHHPDHFGASEALRAETGAVVHLHAAELERIEYVLQAPPDDMVHHSRRHGMPIPPGVTEAPKPSDVWAATFRPALAIDRFLADGDVLALGKRRLQVVWTPGHTPGHCCLLDLDARLLFVGDHLLPKITPHVGVYATGPTNPLGDFVASQHKVAALDDVRLVCPAHGPVYRDHRHRAHQLVAHHDYRLRGMLDVIRAAPATAFAVARQAFHWVFEDGADRFHMGAAVMETIAHLQLLAARGQASVEERDGVVFYRAA
jgi:glyoxylase-like metal-dependent hydrolase (beta-lactamase superfamily II)